MHLLNKKVNLFRINLIKIVILLLDYHLNFTINIIKLYIWMKAFENIKEIELGDIAAALDEKYLVKRNPLHYCT